MIAPQADVHIKVVPLKRAGWQVFLWLTDDPTADLAPWLSQHTDATFQRQVRERLSIYTVPELPDGWELWEMPFEVTDCRVSRSGQATLELHGNEGQLRAFAAGLGARDAPSVRGDGLPGSKDHQPVMTHRQHGAVAVALSAGYFEVPRRTRLQDLADTLDTSVGGLSEMLRRAQANLLEAYLETHPAPGARLDPARGVV